MHFSIINSIKVKSNSRRDVVTVRILRCPNKVPVKTSALWVKHDTESKNVSMNINNHRANMSVLLIPPYIPLLDSKSGGYSGIRYFLIFALKH